MREIRMDDEIEIGPQISGISVPKLNGRSSLYRIAALIATFLSMVRLYFKT